MSVKENIISFWKKVRRQSSDMFTLFKVGIGVKVPTNKLHVKDSADPIKVEGMTTKILDSSNVLSYNLLQVDSDGVIYKTHHHGGVVVSKIFDKNSDAYITALGSGNILVSGDLQVGGNDIKDDDGTTCITFDSSGNTTIAGTTSGTFSGNLSGNASGLSSTLAVGSGGTGATTFTSNAILTGNGTSAIQAESGLTYTNDLAGEALLIGNDDDGAVKISRLDHTDGAGGNLGIFAGSAGADNSAGGDLQFYAGYGKGSGGGGKFEFISNTTTGTAGDLGAAAVKATLDKDGNLTIAGDLTVTGNDIKDDDGTTCITFDSSGNTTVTNTLNASVTGNLTGNASGSSGSCTGNAATATALATARAINGVDFDGSAAITVTAAGSTLSDTVPVSKGGTGATTLASTSLLTGNGTSAVQAESGLTYSGELLVVGNGDAGLAEIVRRNSSTATAGQFRLRGSTATGTDKVGGELSLAGGPGTGTAAGGAIKFYNWTPYGGSGSVSQSVAVEIAAFDNAGNLQIDGGLTVGSTSFVNSSGVVQVATQGTIDHDSLANFVAAEHYRWDTDISSTATINAANIPTLNQNTTGNAATATLATNAQGIAGATDGDVTITSDGHVVVKLDADNDESNQRFKITDNTDAVVFHVQEDGNVLLAGSTITNSGSDNDLTIESDGSMGFTIDRDNDETSQKFSFVNYNTEIASITEGGSLVLGDTDGTSVSITTPAHDNGNGSNLNIAAGFATAGQTDKSGGTLALYAGQSTGTGVNEIRFYTYPAAGSTGTSLNSAVKAVTITNDSKLRVDGNAITNNATASNFDIASSRRLFLQHASSYDVSIGDATNTDVLKVQGGSEVVTVNGALTVSGDITANGNIVGDNATDISGINNITASGIITGKQREIYLQSFTDDLTTAKHYLPWKDINEQTTIYQEEAAMVMPCDGRIVSVTVRVASVTGSGNMTIGIETIAPNINSFGSANWTEEETETLAVSSSDDYHVFHFAFDNAKHFDSGDLVSISIQNDADLSSTTFWYVSTVVEYDWNTFLGTTSAEHDSNP